MLVEQGMKPELLDEVDRQIVAFEAMVESARNSRREHIGARAELEVIAVEIMQVVRVLDGITRYRFGMNPEKMVEWRAVRRVPGQPQASRLASGEIGPEPGGVAPAA